jgi:endonuclease YncB( thermonuclease family)
MKQRIVTTAMALALMVGAGAALAASPRKAAQAAPPPPVEITGTVSRVVDGDTLVLKTADGDMPVTVRIEGIDAPESCQAGGKEATAALAELVLNRSVTFKPVATDDWGRKVGKLYDGTRDIGDRMVRDGHAWSTRFKYDRGPYVSEERMAQALKRGLHGEPGAIQPRDFRQRNGACPGAEEASAARPAPAAAVAVPVAATSARPAATSASRCDGRVYCSQMRSCEEAKWFLANCPGTKMDGNRDGVPCEKQWCVTAQR